MRSFRAPDLNSQLTLKKRRQIRLEQFLWQGNEREMTTSFISAGEKLSTSELVFLFFVCRENFMFINWPKLPANRSNYFQTLHSCGRGEVELKWWITTLKNFWWKEEKIQFEKLINSKALVARIQDSPSPSFREWKKSIEKKLQATSRKSTVENQLNANNF